jgi:hypothetical protein
MLLRELLNMNPLPFEWLDNERATFSFNEQAYGIFVGYMGLTLDVTEHLLANISFGTLKGPFNGEEDLDTSLTNIGSPRRILATVAEACLANKDVVDADIICLAAGDQAKHKRVSIYSLALSEIRTKVPKFQASKDIRLTAANGAQVIVLSAVEFTKDEQSFIASELKLTKQ